jgi:outer membrane protein OmpA-like peptidoglycan-associated protein
VLLLTLAVAPCVAGCDSNPALTPVQWFHDLQGGEIAATRPPPPGADMPYPHLGTIPPKPTLPTPAFRQTVQTELMQDRDTTERAAARTPIDFADLPAPPPKPAPTPPGQDTQTANATLPAADAPAPKGAPPAAAAPDGGPAPGTPVSFVGAAPDEAALPEIPAAAPAPPTFLPVAAQPAPTPAPAISVPPAPPGAARVLFATGDATFNPSQVATVKDVVQKRGKGTIAVEGHGEAVADTPGAQQAAVELGLKRAQAVAKELAALHVPPANILLSATAFGRDSTLTVQ